MAKSTAPKAKAKTIGAPSPKLGVGTVSTNDAPKAEQAEGEAVDFSIKEFPLTLVATNNSPIPVFLNEAGVMLPANFLAPLNTVTVTFATADHLAREIANIEAIAVAHSFENVLQLAEVEEGAPTDEVTAGKGEGDTPETDASEQAK